MATKQLLQLPETQFSGLEFSNILTDVYNLVRENPEYNENWDDFLSSNAGVMITEIFAWITDQLATRIDWVVNENFIGTATQKGSIINLLKLIGYKFQLPASAEVLVEINFINDIGTYVLTTGYDYTNESIYSPKTITAKDKKGNTKYFEAISYDSETQEYIYETTIEVDTSTTKDFSINFYEGQTKIENFETLINQGQSFILSQNPVVRNSVKVYLLEKTDEVITGQTELLEVDTFLNLKAQQEENADGTINEIPYVINVLEDDVVEVAFGSSSLITNAERRLSQGSFIRIVYRIGGGIDGNISRHAINFSENITNNFIETVVLYANKTEGVGSEDSETIENAALSGPLQLKTAGRTVTEEDYDIILSSFANVLLSKAYGHNNAPTDFYEKYGIYINPLEVLNFVIMKKSGWEEIPTSKYKYANWGTFNLENYFNEKIVFNDGAFGSPLTLNSGDKLTLSGDYDFDNTGGRTFKNFKIISTPADWKENIFIEDPNDPGEYIANPDAKASLTTIDYNDSNSAGYPFQLLEDITPHFITDNDDDPFFYGNYNESGIPKQDITEDIHAYFQSKKDVSLGVYIGESVASGGAYTDDPNLIYLNIDGHGETEINLSVHGTQEGVIPLDGGTSPAATNSVIQVINSSIAEKYDNIFSYHDFGVLIEDITAPVPDIENIDEVDWTLRVGDVTIGAEHYIDFDVNAGVTQTFEDLITYMNNAFAAAGTSAYQKFTTGTTTSYTVVDSTQYDFNINVNGTGIVPVELTGAAGTVPNKLTPAELIDMLNISFRANDVLANAIEDTINNKIVISSNETGSSTTIAITAGTTNNLLTIVGGVDTAIIGTLAAGCNLVASFVQSSANIACYDVRISKTNITGEVLISDSGTVKDILAAYGALPLTTSPVAWGDYSEVATVVENGDERYIRIESPNSGPNAGIIIKQPPAHETRDATFATFGLNYTLDGVTEYECFGQRKLTIITGVTGEDDFGDFIYEHGSIQFNDSIDPPYIWLNYLLSRKDTVKLGSYYTDNFEDTDPEWKPEAHRIYNTIYKLDEESIEGNVEVIDFDVSNFLIEFTKNEINDNSIYVINDDVNENTELPLEVTEFPTVTSIDLSAIGLSGTPDTGEAGSETYIKISINDNVYHSVEITGEDSISNLITILNSTWGVEANEISSNGTIFASIDPDDTNKIVLKIDNRTNTGKIVIYDESGSGLLGAEIFGTTTGEDTTIYADGDYYLEQYIMPADDPDTRTLEEKFGYFNLKINQNSANEIPDLGFYAHFIDDRRHNFLLNKGAEEKVFRVHTDEDDLISLLTPYKMAVVENTFKRPVFSTFDVIANVYILSSVSKEQVKKNVDDALRNFYSLSNTILSENINKSEFIGVVLKVSGVRYIDITYFGKDSETQSNNQVLEIESGFDELLILSDDVYGNSGVQTNGLIFQYNVL